MTLATCAHKSNLKMISNIAGGCLKLGRVDKGTLCSVYLKYPKVRTVWGRSSESAKRSRTSPAASSVLSGRCFEMPSSLAEQCERGDV